jgi:hypothetical protein
MTQSPKRVCLEFEKLEIVWDLAYLREAASAKAGAWKLVLITVHFTQESSIDSQVD